MGLFGCNTKGASSRHRRLHPVRESCVTLPKCPLETSIPTARIADGCTGMRRSRQAQFLMASTEHVSLSLCCAGSPTGGKGRVVEGDPSRQASGHIQPGNRKEPGDQQEHRQEIPGGGEPGDGGSCRDSENTEICYHGELHQWT